MAIPTIPGFRDYLYEYMIHQSLEEASRAAARREDPELTARDRKHLRSRVGEHINDRLAQMYPGTPVSGDPMRRSQDFNYEVLGTAVNQAVAEVYPEAEPVFDPGTAMDSTHPAVNRMFTEFTTAAGLGREPRPNPGGNRLLVSPLDPRYSGHGAMLSAGVELRSISEDDVLRWTEGEQDMSKLGRWTTKVWEGHPTSEDGRLRERGAIATVDDQSGLSALRPYMSEKEYTQHRDWALAASRVPGRDGQIRHDSSTFMSPQARERATAVLDYMADNGISYEIVPDDNPGQLRAKLSGTGLSVRVMDTHANDAYVGARVYDTGKTYTYSIETRGNNVRQNTYHASPEEAVMLLRVARGERVAAPDGQGVIGQTSANLSGQQRSWHDPGGRDSGSKFQVGTVSNSEIPEQNGRALRIKATANRVFTPMIHDQEQAETMMRDWVDAAQRNLSASLEIEEMYAMATDPARAGESPEFAADEGLSQLQQDYWSNLVQYRSETEFTGPEGRPEARPLLLPGVSEADYRDAEAEGPAAAAALRTDVDYDPATGRTTPVEPIEAVRAHAGAVVREQIGTYEPDGEGVRFNPITVAQHMDPSESVMSNQDALIAALRKSEITPDQLRGEDFYNKVIADRMITYDESTSQSMMTHENPYLRRFGKTIAQAIGDNGADVALDADGNPDVRIDDKGVVQWRAERRMGASNGDTSSRARQVTGQIGQIFARGEHGEITTNYGSGENHMFVPGYEATIVRQKPGEFKSVEERTKLTGYEQRMADSLRYRLRRDLGTQRSEVGDPTSVNQVHRQTYGHTHPVDYLERSAEEGMTPEWQRLILATEGSRVLYNKEFGDGASLRAKLFADRRGFDPLNDNTRDALVTTGGRDMTRLYGEIGKGYFDPEMTGTARNHGSVRYLVESAQVDENGFIVKGDENDRGVMMKHEALRNTSMDPHARVNMTVSALLQGAKVTEGTRAAMLELKGWNFEDGIVISTDFADKNPIRGVDDAMRPLTVGDKLTDLHGNKGVISLVVDPQMEPEEAARQQLTEEVQLFKDNPDLEVVMSPFSFVSRQNGGSARDLMDGVGGAPQDLKVGDRTVPGGIGATSMVVTHMAVDAKTNIYDAEAVRTGRSRKASSQLAWAVQSQDCPELMKHFYGNNTAGVAKTREYLVGMGFDMTPDGTIQTGYNTELSPERELITMGQPLATGKNGRITVPDRKRMKADIGERIGHAGGVMELPFPVKMASGVDTPQIGVDEESGRPRYGLPVLSSSLRSERDLNDGTVTHHDYTNRYTNIYLAAMEYENRQERLEDPSLSQKERNDLLKETNSFQQRAQGQYAGMAADLERARVNSKTNMFKESLMSAKTANSATAVWTPDPRLDVNQVAMNSEMARELGVRRHEQDVVGENSVGHTLMWRDPVWRDSGLRYMEVVIDDNLTGVAINPVVAESFDGDFDGDAVGLVSNLPDRVHAEAQAKLTMGVNALDVGQGKEVDGQMVYPLSTAHGQDTVLATAKDPELAARYEAISDAAHENLADRRAVAAPDAEQAARMAANDAVLIEDMNEFYHDALKNQVGDVTISFNSPAEHMASVRQSYQMTDPSTGEVIEHGAKGSESKFADYQQQIGIVEQSPGQFVDHGRSLVSTENREKEQTAVGIKTESVGDAGTKSHQAVRLLRAQGLIKEASHISYAATQSILQAKKDPVDAIYRENTVSTAVGDQWSGFKMNKSLDENGKYVWERATDHQGQPQQATREQWVEQYMDMYASKQGMGVAVSRDMVETVSYALSDANGMMYNVEKQNWAELPADKQPLPMDQLAYKGTMDDLKALAGQKANLFTGASAQFAPEAVRANQRAMAAQHSAELNGAELNGAGQAGVSAPEIRSLEVKDTRVTENQAGRARPLTPETAPAAQGQFAQSQFAPVQELASAQSAAQSEQTVVSRQYLSGGDWSGASADAAQDARVRAMQQEHQRYEASRARRATQAGQDQWQAGM